MHIGSQSREAIHRIRSALGHRIGRIRRRAVGMAAVPRAGRVGRRRRPEAARRVRAGQEREVESAGSRRVLVARSSPATSSSSPRSRSGKLYTIAYARADGKEAWRAEAPAKKIERLPQDRGQPGRVHAGDRRQADRVLLRLLRAVLLRPGRQGTLAVRAADRGHARRLRHRRLADHRRRHRRPRPRRAEGPEDPRARRRHRCR